jgi:hypothetical protein
MRKLITVILILAAFVGSETMAIGLPNNAYIQRRAALNNDIKDSKIQPTKSANSMISSQVKEGYADDHASTLDSANDLKEFSKAILNRIVSFVSMILLSLSSFGSSLAGEIHTAHIWMPTDLPSRV